MSINESSVTKSPECITPSAFDKKSRQQSAKVGIFNLISTMIGGGALSLPFAISRCGLVLGFSLLILSAMLSVFSFDILIATSRRTGAMTYQQIGFHAFGKSVSILVTVLILVSTYVASIAYCVLVGDLMKPAVCYIFKIDESTSSLREIIIAVAILCVSPFCYMRKIGALKYTSVISMTSITILTGIITVKTIQHFNEDHTIYFVNDQGQTDKAVISTSNLQTMLWPTNYKDVIYVFPVFAISFLCHFNIPQVHSELTRPTRKRMRKVLFSVVVACFILYSTISFFGYFYSFQYTCGNILLNYRQDDPVVTFGRLCLGFVILFTYPLLILPARTSIHTLLNECCSFPGMNLQRKEPEFMVAKESDSHAYTQHLLNQDIQPNSPRLIANNNEVQEVMTRDKKVENEQYNSLVGASASHSDIAETDVRTGPEVLKKTAERKSKAVAFMSRSFSLTNSPLRGPRDALGVINQPDDVLLYQDLPFAKSFEKFDSSSNHQPSNLFFIIETTFMIFSSLLVSFLTESVMVLWGLLGSTVGFMIAFTLPGFFYWKIRYHKGCKWRNVVSLMIGVLSCVAIVLCTWQAVLRLNVETCPTQPPIN
eukprot:23083_1